MATEKHTSNGAEAAPAPRKRRAPEGPRKVKPVHAAVEVLTEDGQPVPNAKITVKHASKDFESVYSHLEQNPNHSRVRIPLDSLAD